MTFDLLIKDTETLGTYISLKMYAATRTSYQLRLSQTREMPLYLNNNNTFKQYTYSRPFVG